MQNQPRKKQVHCLKDFEEKAKQRLEKANFGYFSAGADDQYTVRNNINAFSKIMLLPRVLRDMSNISMETKFLGMNVKLPFGVAPVALQKLVHPQGQVLLAKEAQKQGTVYGLSMLTTTGFKDISLANKQGVKIQQLYLLKSAQFLQQFIKIVQGYGFKALAITVDSQVFGKRRADDYNKFTPNPWLQIFNQLGIKMRFKTQKMTDSFVYHIRSHITWDLIKKIKSLTTMKIILKGVVSPEDIPLADQAGVDAIWISNHGGRQLDTAPATIEALPFIKNAIVQNKSKMQIYIDGGVRRGSDIFKCLAMGADFVFLGRGFLYSIIDGSEGPKKAFQILKKQLYTIMFLCGTKSIQQINRKYIQYQPAYSKL